MKRLFLLSATLVSLQMVYSQIKYPIVDTGQKDYYSNNSKIEMPMPGEDFTDKTHAFMATSQSIKTMVTVPSQILSLDSCGKRIWERS